jgi:type I restriction enzyme, R subunit
MSDREVLLTRDLRAALTKLNKGLPEAAYEEAIRQITVVSASQTIIVANREKYDLLRDGVRVLISEIASVNAAFSELTEQY